MKTSTYQALRAIDKARSYIRQACQYLEDDNWVAEAALMFICHENLLQLTNFIESEKTDDQTQNP
jgi:hypothetical protein